MGGDIFHSTFEFSMLTTRESEHLFDLWLDIMPSILDSYDSPSLLPALDQPSYSQPLSPANELTASTYCNSAHVPEDTSSTRGLIIVQESATMNVKHKSPKKRRRKLCNVLGCRRFAQRRGVCKGHGGVTICATPGCQSRAVSKHLCFRHGGGRTCAVSDCDRAIQINGRCFRHRNAKQNSAE